MGVFHKLKEGLQKTHSRLVHEIRRLVTGSPRLTGTTLEQLEAILLGADLGRAVTDQIIASVKQAYETQGDHGADVLAIARAVVERSLGNHNPELVRAASGLTVVSVVGVNGTGKTTTCAKLAHYVREKGYKPMLAACDTFRAAAIEQLKLWGERLDVPVIAGGYNADPASVAHDAVVSALARGIDYLFVDTAGRLHTKNNLMQELQKVHRVMAKKLPGAPHEVLLVLDATTGMNALNQAREFHRAVSVSGLVITKLDGTSRGGMVVAINRELGLPVKFVGVGEQVDDLQPFSASSYAAALFTVTE
ncbi:MAG: signal recognition particle-docking protein FtsY [Verrucomicrobiae bacterium]|nr:signal recognition particle-docking protein FtsY [Verrucomicrobiae bacterium]